MNSNLLPLIVKSFVVAFMASLVFAMLPLIFAAASLGRNLDSVWFWISKVKEVIVAVTLIGTPIFTIVYSTEYFDKGGK